MANREECFMRDRDTGNCLCMGGFCLAVNDEICKGLHKAYERGKFVGKFLSIAEVFPDFRERVEGETKEVSEDG